MDLIVLDSEQPLDLGGQTGAHVQRLANLLCEILARTIGSGLPVMPLLAVASGQQLRLFAECDAQELNLMKWSSTLQRLLQCLAASDVGPDPGLLALRCVTAEVLSSLECITFLTPFGGKSCERPTTQLFFLVSYIPLARCSSGQSSAERLIPARTRAQLVQIVVSIHTPACLRLITFSWPRQFSPWVHTLCAVPLVFR